MKKTLFILLVFISANCFSQKAKVDSLKTLLKNAKHDSVTVRLMCEIGEAESNFSFTYWDSLEKKSAELGLQKYQALSLNNMGYISEDQGKAEKAFDYYQQAYDIQKLTGDKEGLAATLGNIGIVYKRQGMLEKALEFYLESLKIKEEIGDKRGIAYSLSNIAVVYFAMGDKVKGLEYDERALEIREEIGDKEGISQSLSNIGVDYIKTDPSKALNYFIRSLKLRREIGGKRWESFTLNNIGFVFYSLAEKEKNDSVKNDFLSKALDYYNQSLKLSEELKNKTNIAYSYYYLSAVYYLKKDYVTAEDFGVRSVNLAREMGQIDLIRNACDRMSKVYKVQKKFEQALEMHEIFKQMTDSLNNLEMRKSLVKKQLQYEFEKKEAISKTLADAETRKKNIIIVSIGVGLFFLLVFAVYVFRSLRVTQKQKRIIEEQKVLVEEKQKEMLDSIYYAKRIQDSLMPTEIYIERNLKRLKKK